MEIISHVVLVRLRLPDFRRTGITTVADLGTADAGQTALDRSDKHARYLSSRLLSPHNQSIIDQ